MLDSDLAELYGVTTEALNQAVSRNTDRFPADFCFRLDSKEVTALKSQNVISTGGRGGRRQSRPRAAAFQWRDLPGLDYTTRPGQQPDCPK